MARTGEQEIAVGVMRIAAAQVNGVATFHRIKADLPKYVQLTSDDHIASQTRPGEPMWHQIVRNIRSHHSAEGNFIENGYLAHVPKVGYKITDLGRQFLRKKGL